MFDYIRYHGEASKNLQNALDVEYGTNSTYLPAHMPKKKVPMSKFMKVLARFLPVSRPRLAQKFSIVTRAVVNIVGPYFVNGNKYNFICQSLSDG